MTPRGSRADTETAGRRGSARIAWLVQSAPQESTAPQRRLKASRIPLTETKNKKDCRQTQLLRVCLFLLDQFIRADTYNLNTTHKYI